ncbi:hypothetical protein C6V07_10440, partial [Burkholderia gladioli]
MPARPPPPRSRTKPAANPRRRPRHKHRPRRPPRPARHDVPCRASIAGRKTGARSPIPACRASRSTRSSTFRCRA